MWDDNHRLGAQSGSIFCSRLCNMCLCFINESSSIWDQAKAHLAVYIGTFACVLRSAFISIACTIGQIRYFSLCDCRWQGSLLAFGKEMFKELPNASSIWVDLHVFSWERKGKKEISPLWPPWVQRHRSAQEPLSWPAPGSQSFQSAPTSGRLSDPAKHFKRYIRHHIVSFTLSGIWCFIPHVFTLP